MVRLGLGFLCDYFVSLVDPSRTVTWPYKFSVYSRVTLSHINLYAP